MRTRRRCADSRHPGVDSDTVVADTAPNIVSVTQRAESSLMPFPLAVARLAGNGSAELMATHPSPNGGHDTAEALIVDAPDCRDGSDVPTPAQMLFLDDDQVLARILEQSDFVSDGDQETDAPRRHEELSDGSSPSNPAEQVLTHAPTEPADDDFFEELYLEMNPDVAAAVAARHLTSGFEHWRLYGQEESAQGKRNRPAFGPPARSMIQDVASIDAAEKHFDSLSYFALYPDVLGVSDGAARSALNHWMDHGRFEGRLAPGIPREPVRHVDLSKLCQRPFGLNIFGPFGASTGLGTAARATARAVKAAGIPFELWAYDAETGEVRPALHHTGRAPRFRVNLLLSNGDQTARLLAAYPRGHFDNAFNIGVWQWELAAVRPDWFYACEGLDEIWTNSDFQLEAIKSLAPVPVSKIHIPVVAPSPAVTPDRGSFRIPEDAYAFLMVFDIGSSSVRKNPFAAIEAFRQVRADNKTAHLVLKYHSPRFEPDFTRRLTHAMRGMSGITLITDRLEQHQMNVLRASCDCLISPHRSEGYGLNIAEFMSLGKPVIATRYSGNLDFFDDDVGYSIDYRLVTITTSTGPYRNGCIWAEPSVDSLASQMMAVLRDPERAQSCGEAAGRRISELLSVERVGASIDARLKDLGLAGELLPFAKQLNRSDTICKTSAVFPQHTDPLAPMRFPVRPLLSVLVPVYNVPADYLLQCVESVRQQTYPFWELCICNDASTAPDTLEALASLRGTSPQIKVVDLPRNAGIAGATNRALEMASGEFIVLLDNDDMLEPRALEEVVTALSRQPDLDVLYSDEDKIDEAGRKIDHFYKPDWSPEHLESVMYVLHMFVVRKTLLLELGGLRREFDGAQDYDLMLRCSRATTRILHIPKVLYHWRAIPGSAAAVVDAKPTALQNGRRALAEHAIEKYGPQATVGPGLLPGTFRLQRGLTDPPAVTLLILTGNGRIDLPGRGEIAMVDNFVDSILAKTSYPHYEIVVVDNDTLSDTQKARFLELNVRVENFEMRGDFNYAAKANFAVGKARTEHIVILNDDMETIHEDWLTALLDLSQDPDIGAVGARLLHLDGTLQHVGMVIGVNGGAAHIYHGYPREFVGYNAFTHLVRNYSAVTAACLATRKSLVAQMGGFDENFAIDYNDVDFCLRLVSSGFRVVYTPYAELYHFESATAKRESQNPREVELFKSRWSRFIQNDPYYNENLTRSGLDFSELNARSGPLLH